MKRLVLVMLAFDKVSENEKSDCILLCTACVSDQYFVRVYNVDDWGTAIVNGYTVATASYLGDSGYVNINAYLINGMNNFTFTMYNYVRTYNWGFEIRRNTVSMFSDQLGVAGIVGANNDDGSRQYQYVYYKTVPFYIVCP